MSDMAELAETIGALRSELTRALEEGEGESVRFGLGAVELEFQVEVKKAVGAAGGVRFWVMNLGAKAEGSSGTTQTIKLTLQPVGANGEVLAIAAVSAKRPK